MIDASIHRVTGTAVPIEGNDVDTDQIVPARFLKEITFDRMGSYLFYDARQGDSANHPLDNPRYAGASIMLVDHNFGCGSSREHAPQAIRRAGFKALIGASFAEIFLGNCRSLGIVTATADAAVLAQLADAIQQQPQTQWTIDVAAATVTVAGMAALPVRIKDAHQQAFLAGTWDELIVLKAQEAAIRERAKSLPYFSW